MNSKYSGLTQTEGYPVFEGSVFEALGELAGNPEDSFRVLDSVQRNILIETGNNPILLYVAREAVWNQSDQTLRTALSVGKLSAEAWSPMNRSQRFCERLYPQTPDELMTFAVGSGDINKTARVATAVNRERSVIGGVNSRLVPWATAIYKVAHYTRREELCNSLWVIKYSHDHTDSEDLSIPHPVSTALLDEELPLDFREFLLERAALDAMGTPYKSPIWKARLDVTLQDLARNKTNQLRFRAREKLGLPQPDKDFAMYEDRMKRDQESIEALIREEALTEQQERVVSRITAVLQDS